MSDPKPATIDFTSAVDEETPRKQPDRKTEQRAIAAADKEGFSARIETMHLDGRSLRKRAVPKVQMNMKVTPELRIRFLRAARAATDDDAAVVNLGDFLETVFDHYERTGPKPR